MAFSFTPEINEHCEVFYAVSNSNLIYLHQKSVDKVKKVLLYANTGERKSELVFDFYDFFIADQEELKSSRSLANKTQKLIE